MKFKINFLERKYRDNTKLFHNICDSWGMNEREFCKKVDEWFFNFKTDEEYSLGLKILERINYVSENSFNDNLAHIFRCIQQETALYDSDQIVYILPNDYVDSALGLIYRVSKIQEIAKNQVVMLKDLSCCNHQVYVAFNDTHGTGNQFVKQLHELVAKNSEILNDKLLIIAGIVITDISKKYILSQFSHIKGLKIEFISAINTPETVNDAFTRRECDLIEELGYDVNPSSPIGYGNSGLLIAYHYQCPNNTIPIIWSRVGVEDVRNKSKFRVWQPLFEYKSKNTEENKPSGDLENKRKKYTNIRKLFQLSDIELEKINSIIDSWECSDEKHNRIISNLGRWFANFGIAYKDLAIYILEKVQYFSVLRTRHTIKELQTKLIRKIGPSINRKDILLVLTGDDIETSYQYVYDFIRIWHLAPSQIITLKKLHNKPYEALNKHLVYFHHTRIHRGETFVPKVWPKVEHLPAASHNIMSIMLSDVTKAVLDNDIICQNPDKKINYFYDEEVSKTIADSFENRMLSKLKEFYVEKFGKRLIGTKFITAYYFNCPKDTLPLLWYDRVTIKGNTKKWHPLL